MMWFMSTALAGSVFVNGVNIDTLRSQTFENCVVTIDSQGNILITAPGYQIQVEGSTASTPPPPPPPPPPVNSSAGLGAAGHWWLVTEDNGSQGHSVDVVVNGTSIKTVKSGDAQVILDIGPYLHAGSNQVHVTSNSVGAAGGTMYVYVGTGTNSSGTVVLDRPQIQYGLGASRTGEYSRDYTLDVGS
jgi:hypothetical protein